MKVTRVDLDQRLTGYRRFISSWLVTSEGFRYAVDPGPASTIPLLIDEIHERLGGLDAILLTHIHIDHAGGTGRLLDEFPHARVVTWPKARRHLVDPKRLWQGSLSVLGDVARAYGEIVPVREDAIVDPEWLESVGIETFDTPGHAPHHITFVHHGWMFVGEALGTRADVDSGIYRRPATPPRFVLEVAAGSVAEIRARLAAQPHTLAFGHHGLEAGAGPEVADDAAAQLGLWTDIAREHEPATAMDRLLDADAAFARFAELPDDIQERERTFIGNSLMGMREWALRDSAG